jgi:hypothetical protein
VTIQNEIIAQRIIEGARAGVRDPHDLCKMAVKDVMVPSDLLHNLHCFYRNWSLSCLLTVWPTWETPTDKLG